MTAGADAYGRAHRLAQVGRYDDAERAARDGLATDPGDVRLLTLLASVLRLRRDYAVASRQAADNLDPRDTDDNRLRRHALERSRKAINGLRADGSIGDAAYRQVEQELDQLELATASTAYDS